MLKQFVGYSIFGTLAFGVDLALIYLFYEILGLVYVLAVPLAFVIATSGHYALVRRFVFAHTERPVGHGYILFMAIMISNALLVTLLVASLVELANLNLYVARVGVAGFIGLISFFLNARYNFRTL